jgi:integrase
VTPATYSHGAGRERITWLPPSSYRRWRDVGVRGYTTAGLPDDRFRGRWAGRNAAFCDLMVRSGLRLSEQAALSVFEVPLERGAGGYQRFWLPPALAKGGSARWVYVPASVIADLVAYAGIDRAEVIGQAREAGRYARIYRPLVVVPDRQHPVAVEHRGDGVGQRVKVASLDVEDRRRLLIEGPDGLEPAGFWLSEYGLPVAVPTWKHMFSLANARCRRMGLELHAHAHLLRHTFAVVTLEQLQRGHITALAELTPEQRGQYTRVFGDPLDWVRRRLGHRSVTTTQIYLHALAELEMHTRMALVPDGWEDPRDYHADGLVDDQAAAAA